MSMCIAVGKGSGNDPHYIFRDIDHAINLEEIHLYSNAWLIYRTHGKQEGAHFIAGTHKLPHEPLVDLMHDAAMLKELADPKAPHNAIRIYPNNDYRVIRLPSVAWSCCRLAKLYGALLGIHIPCYLEHDGKCEPLRFGVYRRFTPQGQKAHGAQRVAGNKAVQR
jgi:hypothetical protein